VFEQTDLQTEAQKQLDVFITQFKREEAMHTEDRITVRVSVAPVAAVYMLWVISGLGCDARPCGWCGQDITRSLGV
jgi:hypothetical protein